MDKSWFMGIDPLLLGIVQCQTTKPQDNVLDDMTLSNRKSPTIPIPTQPMLNLFIGTTAQHGLKMFVLTALHTKHKSAPNFKI